MKRRTFASVVVTLSLLFVGEVQMASAVPMPAIVLNTAASEGLDSGLSIGYEFVTTDAIYVTALGYFKSTNYPGTNDVGIYETAGGTLVPGLSASVVSTAVSGNGTEYDYTELGAPVLLPAGTYRIAGTTAEDYPYVFNDADINDSFGVDYIAGRYVYSPTLAYPSENGGFKYVMANFLFTTELEIESVPVPEPSSLMLLGLGGLVMSMRTRRSKTRAYRAD